MHLPSTNHHRNVIIDFMANAKKVAIKKHATIFSSGSRACSAFFSCDAIEWIFFFFDVYKENSI